MIVGKLMYFHLVINALKKYVGTSQQPASRKNPANDPGIFIGTLQLGRTEPAN